MSSEVPVGKSLEPRHFLPMLAQQLVGAVVDAEVLMDALALNVGVVAVEIDHGMAKIPYRHAVAAECTGAVGVCGLKLFQIGLIQNKGLQFVPYPVQMDLHPAVEHILRCEGVHEPRHCALLQPLVDGEAVHAAGDAAAAQQRHEQRPLGIALAEAVGQYP